MAVLVVFQEYRRKKTSGNYLKSAPEAQKAQMRIGNFRMALRKVSKQK